MKKETYKIYNMHCASCVRTIEDVLTQTHGVKSASVNFATESALIEFDEKEVSPKELADVVGEVGYKLGVGTEESGSDDMTGSAGSFDSSEENGEVTLKVIGMGSPHCAGVVEKAVRGLFEI